ncbi:hypothetical protein P7B02_08455 [Caulobacter segnis]|uniref:hypothetical protein n=1 Tax=Caulobacter segnis TaxID=88688 RepID=UPI002410232C|nr:hypothetical protein [Caulobacter segnis]MDG2521571.1 hypothetical protein [Caulobacter segnis]
MSRLSMAFFTAGALCGLIGMGWGVYMGASHDHTTFPAHAHLNLLGWVSLFLMGGFYAFLGDRAPAKLGWTNFVLSAVGAITMAPTLALLLKGNPGMEPAVGVTSLIAFAGMITFVVAVLGAWRRTV